MEVIVLPDAKEIGGVAINGSYFSNHYSDEDQSPQVQGFIKKYKEAFGVTPDGLAATGYDAALVLADAMKRSGDLTTKNIRDAIAATKDFQAVTGRITMDVNRNPVKSAVVLKIVDGQYKYQTTIMP